MGTARQSKGGSWLRRVRGIGIALLVCGVALWIFFWAVSSILTRIFPPLATSYSASMDVVDVSLTDEKDDASISFSIPKAYLTDARNRRGGEQRILKMQAFLPDMIPYFEAKQEISNEYKYPWGTRRKLSDFDVQRIYIRVMSKFNGNNVIEQKVCRGEKAEIVAQDVYDLLACSSGQYNMYQTDTHTLPYPLNVADVLYARDNNGKYYLRMDSGFSLRIQVYGVYRGWDFDYSIAGLQLENWKEIHRAVVEFLDAFFDSERMPGSA